MVAGEAPVSSSSSLTITFVVSRVVVVPRAPLSLLDCDGEALCCARGAVFSVVASAVDDEDPPANEDGDASDNVADEAAPRVSTAGWGRRLPDVATEAEAEVAVAPATAAAAKELGREAFRNAAAARAGAVRAPREDARGALPCVAFKRAIKEDGISLAPASVVCGQRFIATQNGKLGDTCEDIWHVPTRDSQCRTVQPVSLVVF